MKPKNKIQSLILLVWIGITVVSAFFIKPWPGFHPFWSVLTTPLIGIVALSKDKDKTILRPQLFEIYGLVAGLVLSLGTGLGVKMKFFPHFFHQIIIWPLTLFFVAYAFRELKTNSIKK